jgi:wyosine [tRNA(Phe)-imidazoG37] synthetase (radical SAM superfamily)
MTIETAPGLVFGPVPSRRLGRSLGVNNIPPKVCSYSCIYCQLGSTADQTVERRTFYSPEEIVQAVAAKRTAVEAAGDRIDYVTFVPDGEPTLDLHLGQAIMLVRSLGMQVAVITNGSLVWREDVRQDLLPADWVSLKVDAVDERIWRIINRPAHALAMDDVLQGMQTFTRLYTGTLTTETMLVSGVNDAEEHLTQTAQFVVQLAPAIAYLALPTRPPAEPWVRPADEQAMLHAYHIFQQHLPKVEYLTEFEGTAFVPSGPVAQDLLDITAVHPMREDAVRTFLARAGAEWSAVQELLARGQLIQTEYQGQRFYLRRLSPHAP